MDSDLASMSRVELLTAKRRFEDDLEDAEEMFAFHSINSPSHVTASERTREANRHQRLRDAIDEIDELLRRMPEE